MTSSPQIGRKIILTSWLGILLPYLFLVFPIPLIISLNLLSSIPAHLFIICSICLAPIISFSFPKLSSFLPESLDDWFINTKKYLLILWSIGVLFAWFSLGSIAIYLMDSNYTKASLLPDDPFMVHHSCLTAYLHGAILTEDPTANVYDLLYVDLKMGDPLPPTANIFDPFKLDAFGYPPPFLLFPKLLLIFTKNYLSLRAIFSGLSLLIAFFSIYLIANTLEDNLKKRLFIFTPLVLSSPPVAATLQVGNFHLIAISSCLIIWVLLEKNKFALSGSLLAIATLSKIFPGLLGIILIMQKRYKAIIATILFAILFCGITYLTFGWKVWNDFLFYHMPHVQSGRALAFLADGDQSIEFNLAPFGIPFKLASLGLMNAGWKEAKLFGNIFSVFLLVIAILAGRRKGSPYFRLTIWTAILMFASLRSPFAAAFVLLTLSFLLLILISKVNSAKEIMLFILTYITFSLPFPITDPKLAVGISLVRVVLLYSFLLWVIFRKEKTTTEFNAR